MFPIHQIPPGSALSSEPLGTKFKFWFQDPDFGLTLFKEGRPGTGENWAERIACELAELLDLPHARYEFAQYEGKDGVLSRSLVERGARIIHGNELLSAQITDYGQDDLPRYRNTNHTLRRVVAYLRASSDLVGAPYGWTQTPALRTAIDFFIGYLMLDAWIGNQDRHDENWGLLKTSEGNLFLAPSFDHGSSMARNLTDEDRTLRLNTKDQPRHISTFVTTAKSGFFPHSIEKQKKAILTLDAFIQSANYSPSAAVAWQERLAAIDEKVIRNVVDKVPECWMTEPSRMFTCELLRLNRERILAAKLQ